MTNPTITPAMIEAGFNELRNEPIWGVGNTSRHYIEAIVERILRAASQAEQPSDLLARIEQLEAALWPFAQYARAREHCWKNLSDDNAHFGGKLPGDNLKIGDFRRAASAVVMQPPTRKEGKVQRHECPDCERASIDNHDFTCTRGPNCVEKPTSPGMRPGRSSPPGKEAEEIARDLAEHVGPGFRGYATPRIQSIIDERDAAQSKRMKAHGDMLKANDELDAERARAEAAEAKLAIAVEALETVRVPLLGYYGAEDYVLKIDAAIDEIEKEPNEPTDHEAEGAMLYRGLREQDG